MKGFEDTSKKKPCPTCAHNFKAAKIQAEKYEEKLATKERTVESLASQKLELIDRNKVLSERNSDLLQKSRDFEWELIILKSTGRQTFISQDRPPTQQNQMFIPPGPFISRGPPGSYGHH